MEINNKTASTNLVGDIKSQVHKITEARTQYYRQAMVNVMFLYGNHHFSLSRHSSGSSIGQRIVWEMERLKKDKDSVRCTSNYILPLFRSAYSRLISQKGTVHAQATTHSQTDRDAAKVSKEVGEDFWDNCNRNNPWVNSELSGMQAVLMKLILYKMTVGMGYLFPWFNPKAKTFVFDQARNDSIEAEVGEAEMRVDSPFNVFKDRFGRFIIHRRLLSPEQIEYEFDKKVEPSHVDEESYDIKISRVLDGGEYENEDKDGAYVYHKYCLPTSEYPKGRVIVTSDTDVLYEGDLPEECKEKIPCYEFKYQDLGFARHSQGAITQVVDLQKDYNFMLSRIKQHAKLLTGKIFVPNKAKLSAKFNDVIGQIISYTQGQKPTVEPAPPIPNYFYEEIRRIREDMENLMNSHDVSMGRTPGQVKSGVGIENLTERDNAQILPELIMFELKLGFAMEHVLDICQFKYKERRLLITTGEDMAYEVKSFIGSDLMGRKQVKVKIGSNLPTSKQERTQYILMMKKEGFVSPERAKEMLDADDVEGAFTNLDEIGAKQDILNIIEGNAEVIPEPYEDHTIRLRVINDFRKGNVYQRLDASRRAMINNLADIYQDYLLQEQEAAMRLGGGLPPPAQPQNQGTK